MKRERVFFWMVGFIAVLLLGMVATLLGIAKDLKSNAPAVPQTDYVDLYIDGQFVKLDLETPVSLIELPTLNCENEINIHVNAQSYYQVYFDGLEVSSGDGISYQLQQMDRNYLVPISVVNKVTGGVTKFSLATYPSTVPPYSLVGQSPYEGDYYMTLIAGIDNLAMKVDRNGCLKYYNYNYYGCLADFKKVETPDGIRYLLFTTRATPYDTRGVSHLGDFIVMDDHYHEIKRLSMQRSTHIPVDGYPVDQHDCLYISDSEYYLITYADENVYNIPEDVPHKENGSLVSAAVIQGFKDDKLVFEWASTDCPELYALSVDYNDFTNSTSPYAADYMHINSIDMDPSDGNLIASFRDIDTIMKINVTDSSIMWKLGGLGDDFGLDESQKTSRQHYARYTDLGTITAFDNGNINSQSRIVEYTLDEAGKALNDFKSYQIDGYFSMFTGSVQRIDNDSDVYMIGWGTRTAGDANGMYPQFSEIDFSNGKTLVEFRFTDSNLSTYRCVKCK